MATTGFCTVPLPPSILRMRPSPSCALSECWMLSSRNREKEEEREEMDKTLDPLKCSHFLSLGLGSLT